MSTENNWKKYLPLENKRLNIAAIVFCAAISAHNAYNYFNPEIKNDAILDAYFLHSHIKKEEFEELEKYILKHVPAEDFPAIRRNLKPTTILMEESKDKAYHEGAVMEHACPVEIRKVSSIRGPWRFLFIIPEPGTSRATFTRHNRRRLRKVWNRNSSISRLPSQCNDENAWTEVFQQYDLPRYNQRKARAVWAFAENVQVFFAGCGEGWDFNWKITRGKD